VQIDAEAKYPIPARRSLRFVGGQLRRLTDAALRTSRRPVGAGREPAARPTGLGRVTAGDNRLFVEAALYRYQIGIPWRDLPERFGHWKNTHRRFSRQAKIRRLAANFEHLAAKADNEYAMINSTIVRAHQRRPAPKKA
jgi:transposase